MEKTKQSIQDTFNFKYLIVAILLGATIGSMYLLFEWAVNSGTNWLWNDIVQSDLYRWRVIPLAIVMSIIYSFVVAKLRNKLLVDPNHDLFEGGFNDIKSTTVGKILVIVTIGLLSLLAGASLGPEAALIAFSTSTAAWFSGAIKSLKSPFAVVLTLTSVGVLLCSFFLSMLPAVVPILLLKKLNKLNVFNAVVVLFASASAYLIVWFAKGEPYIHVPVKETFTFSNIIIAAMLGLASFVIGLLIHWANYLFFKRTQIISKSTPVAISALVFGGVLGILYFIGGQTIQFSGSEGTKLLAENISTYSIAALIAIVVTKILATSWSTSSGYRGGLVFPSIFTAIAGSFLVTALFKLSESDETGAIVGSISGMLISMTNPLLGVVLTLTLFPVTVFPVIVGGVFGAMLGKKTLSKYSPPPSKILK